MNSTLKHADSVKCYVNSNKHDEIYLEVTMGDNLKKFRINNTYPFSVERRFPEKTNFRLSDYSAVPTAQRKIVEYDFLILKSTISRSFDDFEGCFLLFSCDTKVTLSPFIPSGYTETDKCIIKTLIIKEWQPSQTGSYLGYFGKVIATPFTIVADIIIVPVSYSVAYIHFWNNFPH